MYFFSYQQPINIYIKKKVPVQGGIYSEKLSHTIIDHLLISGAYGAGQSSWGPAVYGLTLESESDEVARCMTEFLESNKIKGNVSISSGHNKGAEVEVLQAEYHTEYRGSVHSL